VKQGFKSIKPVIKGSSMQHNIDYTTNNGNANLGGGYSYS